MEWQMKKLPADKRSRTQLKHQTLNDIVYEAVKKKIANLTIQPGDQLREKELAEELGVSKSPIREAFRRLEKTGLVYVVPFKGCFVSPLSMEELKDAFQLREVLEVHSLAEGLSHYTDGDIREFKRLDNAAGKKFKQGNKHAASEALLSVHRLIVKKAGNVLIEKTHKDLIENTLRRYLVLGTDQISSRAKISAQQHRNLVRAIEKKDVFLAVNALKEHLRSLLKDYLAADKIPRHEKARKTD
jgi:DNA-binding GntR family transcriptional regulator